VEPLLRGVGVGGGSQQGDPAALQTLQHPSDSVTASVSIALLEKAEQFLSAFGAITLLADRAFPCVERLSCFRGRSCWSYVMPLMRDTEIHGTAAPLGCQVRPLHLRRGPCRSFRGVRLWADGSQSVHLVIAISHAVGGVPLVSDQQCAPDLDLVWSKRFCCEQLFRDQISGVFQLSGSVLRKAQRTDRLLLVVAFVVLPGSLLGYALSLSGLRRQVDPH
jgi:hypothetical protein